MIKFAALSYIEWRLMPLWTYDYYYCYLFDPGIIIISLWATLL